jgi:Glycosyl hydrolase family 30 TIM-barrel domain
MTISFPACGSLIFWELENEFRTQLDYPESARGVAIQAVSSQNEVDTDQDGRMPACLWGQEYEIEFIAKHLGPALDAAGLSTKIWLLDHNYNLWGRVICSLDDAKVRQHCGSVAWHGYVGTADMTSKVHVAHPDVSMHWTEGGPITQAPITQQTGPSGEELSATLLGTGVPPSRDGTLHWMNKDSPTSDLSNAVDL